ncbi:hypothetical protein BAE44_0019662 [Dichanthelium oligosanthes]|uniref:Uncharacterized protein n=1 Tax=Dichanthelium oligosanthes TaxID=888268 RepID=A0A1E5V2P6_9POAL|nr:hypothetical protein BAE44_0019662 [Dichanthelium oligosanthes]
MEVQVVDLSSDSEDEVSAHSPQHKRPARQAGPGADRGGGDTGIGGSVVDRLSRQEDAARSLRQPGDAVKKGKEKVGEGESAWAAGPPKFGGEPIGAGSVVVGAGSDPWGALVSKRKGGDGGDVGAGCWGGWGDWGDQLRNSVPGLQQGSESKEFHSGSAASGDRWKGILGARPADPTSTLWYPWDAGKRENEVGMFTQGSLATREVSGCDDILMEDSSSTWLSRIKGLNFPLPDEHQMRTRQIEDDELFARRLQVQLNQEQGGSQHCEEVDMTIAWTLQNAEHTRFAAREEQSSSRLAVLESLKEAFDDCEDTLSPDSDEVIVVRMNPALYAWTALLLVTHSGICHACTSFTKRWLGMRISCPVCKSTVFSE